jgi:hypothetical protein
MSSKLIFYHNDKNILERLNSDYIPKIGDTIDINYSDYIVKNIEYKYIYFKDEDCDRKIIKIILDRKSKEQ